MSSATSFRTLVDIRAWGRVVGVCLIFVGFALATATLILAVKYQWHDGPFQISSVTHDMPEADYANLWAAGKFAAAGHAASLYDGSSFFAWRQETFGATVQRLDWLYPPPMVALGLAVERIPLLPGYFLWLLLTSSVSVWVLRTAGLSWRVVLLGLSGPPTWRGMILGQYAPTAAALTVAALLLASRAPVRAGLAAALVTLKPQVGIFVPIVLAAQRRWAAFMAASLATTAIGVVTTGVLGSGIWSAFLHDGSASGRAILETHFAHGYPVNAASVFWMARSFDLPIALCYAVQVSTAVTGAGLS